MATNPNFPRCNDAEPPREPDSDDFDANRFGRVPMSNTFLRMILRTPLAKTKQEDLWHDTIPPGEIAESPRRNEPADARKRRGALVVVALLALPLGALALFLLRSAPSQEVVVTQTGAQSNPEQVAADAEIEQPRERQSPAQESKKVKVTPKVIPVKDEPSKTTPAPIHRPSVRATKPQSEAKRKPVPRQVKPSPPTKPQGIEPAPLPAGNDKPPQKQASPFAPRK